MQCSVCSKPVITQTQKVYRDAKLQSGPNIEILYPVDRTPLAHLPEMVERKYAEALKVRNVSPSSCAVQVRKTLEAVCTHENAQGRVLADQLRSLAASGRIPQTLVEVATHLKQLGNLGAHFIIPKSEMSISLLKNSFVELCGAGKRHTLLIGCYFAPFLTVKYRILSLSKLSNLFFQQAEYIIRRQASSQLVSCWGLSVELALAMLSFISSRIFLTSS